MRVPARVSLIVVLIGCNGIPRPDFPIPPEYGKGGLPKPQPDRRVVPEDVDDTLSMIEATYAVLQSQAFQSNLEGLDGRFGELWLSPYGATIPAPQTATVYLGRDRHRLPVPTTLMWGAESGKIVAVTDLGPRDAAIEIGAQTLVRWRSNSHLRKSCAINTLAHELTHTVPQLTGGCVYLFADGNRGYATAMGRPLVSYTVGAVAQCTYLQTYAPSEVTDLADCVERWGTNNFYPRGCDR